MHNDTPGRSAAAVERRVQVVSLALIAAVAIAGALYWLKPAMIPFVLAILVTHALAPLIEILTDRARMPRWAAIVVALVLVAGGFLGLGLLVSTSVQQLTSSKDVYEARIEQLLTDGAGWLGAYGIEVDAERLKSLMRTNISVGDTLVKLTNALMALVSNTFLVLVFALYLLAGRHATRERGGLRGEIEGRVRKYLVLKLGLSAATGVAVGLILLLLDVDLALLFGVLTFVLNFIPNVGSIIATLLPIPVVLVDPGAGPWTIALAILLPGTVQMVVGNVLEPKMMGDLLDLHPITVLLALILWGMLWGIPGMLLAVPLTAVLKLLLEPLPLTAPLARLMAGHLSREPIVLGPEGQQRASEVVSTD
ncbi:MAG: AI-2E family transporter [Myxococcales bacterium]|nr:AI-2E family transporter [Myxococcales bacterium]MCB9539528.1 AI-2E family transporter [Myxococcales bacterium]